MKILTNAKYNEFISRIQTLCGEIVDLQSKYGLLKANYDANNNVINELNGRIGGLTKENNKLQERLEKGKEQYNDLVEEKENLHEELSSKILELEELNKKVKELEREEVSEWIKKWYVKIEQLNKFGRVPQTYELLQRIEQLETNWKELKKFVEKHIKRWEKEEQEWIKLGFMKVGGEANNKIIFKMVSDKMQELESDK